MSGKIGERFSLAGQSALVTGGGSGIGASLASALAEAGARVALADRYLTSAQNIAQQLAATGATTLAIEVDVTQADQVQRMVDQVLAAWGQLDVAVNSAGIARRSRAEELEEDDWDAVVGVDLKGIYLSTRAEGRAMLARGSGSIINIASMSGQHCQPAAAAFALQRGQGRRHPVFALLRGGMGRARRARQLHQPGPHRHAHDGICHTNHG